MFTPLIGPPAVGKSTLIKELNRQGFTAYDLEAISGPTLKRTNSAQKLVEQFKNDKTDVFIGLADVDPVVFPKNSIRIMLLPSLDIYRQRLSERDEREPEKQFQDAQRKYPEFIEWSKKFEHVIQNDSSVDETIENILKIVSTSR